jgi:hypothetical protein
MSEGTPVSYQALAKGTPMLNQAGDSFGTVEHVLQVPELDLFDGVVVKTRHGLRFVDRDAISSITTTQVRCDLSADDVENLPRPDGDEVYTTDPGQDVGEGLTARLGQMFRRAHWTQKEQ